MTTLRPLREPDFQQQVLDIAQLYGWLAYHTYDSRRSAPGFPDLVLVRAPDLIFAELKTDRGRLSAPQREWLAQLEQSADTIMAAVAALESGAPGLAPYVVPPAVEVHVWRPADFTAIQARLARHRARSAA